MLGERDVKMQKHPHAANHNDKENIAMTDSNVAQVELLSQQLTRRFKKMTDLMNEVWLEHELARDTFRQLLVAHYKVLGHEGIPHEY